MKHIISTILFLLPLMAAAQPLTLDQAREMALEHNRKAQQAALQEQVAGQAVRQYRAMFFPDLTVNGGALYSTADGNLLHADLSGIAASLGSTIQSIAAVMPGAAASLGQTLQGLPQTIDADYKVGAVYGAGLSLKQPLYMGGKLRAAYQIAGTTRKMAAQNRRLTDVEVIEQVDEAYINVVRARELATVAERYMDMLAELERNVQSAVELGLKMNSDRLTVQVKRNEVELQLRRAQNGLQLATMSLNNIIGRSLEAATTLPQQPFEGDVAYNASAAGTDASARPEAAIVQQQAEIAASRVKIERSSMMPQLALLANYGYTHGGELKINGDKKYLADGMNFTGGVMLNVPIYHFGERQARVKAARLQQRMAQLQADDVNNLLSLALAQAQCNLDEAQLEQALSLRAVEQAEENLRVSTRQYEAGTITLGDHLTAQAQWQAAQEQRIESICHLHTACTAMKKAQGTLR